jgi:hypothetical protein
MTSKPSAPDLVPARAERALPKPSLDLQNQMIGPRNDTFLPRLLGI